MLLYSDAQIDQVCHALPQYLLHVHGIDVLGHPNDPFRCLLQSHEDRHPSMRYNRKGHCVKCFSCGWSGDVIDLAGVDTGEIDFRRKLRAAAARAGVSLGAPQGAQVVRGSAKSAEVTRAPAQVHGKDVTAAVTNAFIALCSPTAAPAALAAFDYLTKERRLPEAALCRYQLGYVAHPSEVMDGFSTAPHGTAGYICLPLRETGSNPGEIGYCVFRPMFPGAAKERKPKGMPALIWNEHLLTSPGLVYVAEGVYDAISALELAGEPQGDAVALMGTGNARRLVQVLEATPSSSRPTLRLALDRDGAGRKAAALIENACRRLGVACDTSPLWQGDAKDPNEALQRLAGGKASKLIVP